MRHQFTQWGLFSGLTALLFHYSFHFSFKFISIFHSSTTVFITWGPQGVCIQNLLGFYQISQLRVHTELEEWGFCFAASLHANETKHCTYAPALQVFLRIIQARGCSPLTGALGTQVLWEQCPTAAKEVCSICCSQGFSCSGVGSCRRRNKQNWAALKVSHAAAVYDKLTYERTALGLYFTAARREGHGALLPPKERRRCPRVAQCFLIGRCADRRQKQPVVVRGGESPAELSDGAILFAGGYAVSRGAAKQGGRSEISWARPEWGWSWGLVRGCPKGLLRAGGPAQDVRWARLLCGRVSSPSGAGGVCGEPLSSQYSMSLPWHCGTMCWWTESTGVWENSGGLQEGINCCRFIVLYGEYYIYFYLNWLSHCFVPAPALCGQCFGSLELRKVVGPGPAAGSDGCASTSGRVRLVPFLHQLRDAMRSGKLCSRVWELIKHHACGLLDVQCDGRLPAWGDTHKERQRQPSAHCTPGCLLPGRDSVVPVVFWLWV